MKFTLRDAHPNGIKTFFGILAILLFMYLAFSFFGQLSLDQQAAHDRQLLHAAYGPQADSHGNLDGSVVGRYSTPKTDPLLSGKDY